MTISLLAPWAFALSALLAVPLVVHIFKPRRVKRTPFSSLRWLKLSPQKLSRRLQWHQVLLFVLRSALVLLLVAALARPLLSPAGANRPVDRWIVLDAGRSMALQSSGHAPPLETARTLVANLVRQHAPGDRTAILQSSSAVSFLAPLSRDPEAALPALAAITATSADSHLSAALPLIQPQLGGRDADQEIIFVTNNPVGTWQPATIAEFVREQSPPVSIKIMDVGLPGVSNAWISGATLKQLGTPPQHVLRVDLACVGDLGQERTLRLTGLTGQGDQSQPVVLDPGKPGWVEFSLPPQVDLPAAMAHLRLEPADALPDDDEWFMTLNAPSSMRVLLVEAETSPISSQRPGFPLATALDVLAADRLAINVTRRTDRELSPRDIDESDVLILADPGDISAACWEAVTRRVQAGVGLALFLGPHVQPNSLAKLVDPLHPREGLLPEVPRLPEPGSRTTLSPLTDLRASHPLFAGLTDPILSDVTQVQVRGMATFPKNFTSPDEVLARVDGHAPAVIDRQIGAGHVLIVTTGADDAWSDWSRRRSFLPMVDRLVRYLASAGLRRDFIAGQSMAMALPPRQAGEVITIRTPQNQEFTPEFRVLPTGRVLARLTDLPVPGFYTIERSGEKQSFAVNVSRADSSLVSAPTDVIKPWWGEQHYTVIPAEDVQQSLTTTHRQLAIWPWLILVAAIVLAAETYLANRLCPQANPSLARPLVSRTKTT